MNRNQLFDGPSVDGDVAHFRQCPVPGWIVDADGARILDVNDAAVRRYGRPREAFVGTRLDELTVAGPGAPTEGGRGRPLRHRTDDGGSLWVEVLEGHVDVPHAGCRVIYAVDVTERVEALAELERQRSFYEDVLENIDVDIAVLDPELRFEYVNRSSIPDPEMRAWLVGRSNSDYCAKRGQPMELAERRVRSIRHAVEQRARQEDVEAIVGLDGERHIVVRSHLPLFDERGALRRVLGYGFDRTEQVKAQQALRDKEHQLQQIQRLEATGRLAGGVAHDFNNLLTTVRGYAELLLEEGVSDTEARESLLEIRHAADRAAELIRHLLSFSRRNVRAPREIELDGLIRARGAVLRQMLPESLELDVELGAGGARVVVDPGEMEQVVLNLVFNARDAMEEGGRLALSTAFVEGDEPCVRLRVADSGHGMDEATLSRALEPFFTTRGPGQGTGLGLSVVYGIVSTAGGTVDLESAPGEGTTVTVILPAVG